jgi:hypothetical protein
MDATRIIRYEGRYQGAILLVKMLNDEGVHAELWPPGPRPPVSEHPREREERHYRDSVELLDRQRQEWLPLERRHVQERRDFEERQVGSRQELEERQAGSG